MKKMKRKTQNPFKNILKFISEAGALKRVPRSGWALLGIQNAESVAGHSFRCAVIGYLLAGMEKIPPYKILLMTLFNDIQEARITDIHKMASRYIDALAAEDKAFYEQINFLPEETKKELADMRDEYTSQRTSESIIARDADILECLLQAKEYYESGHIEASKFMEKAPNFLKTKSARKLWQVAKKTNLNDWWEKLSEFKR